MDSKMFVCDKSDTVITCLVITLLCCGLFQKDLFKRRWSLVEIFWNFFVVTLVTQADLPTPKRETTGGGLKKTLRLSKKTGDFAKTSPNLIIQSIRMWRLTINTAGLYFTLYFADPSDFLVLPALCCRFGLDSSELSAELESSSICNTVSDSRSKPPLLVKFSYEGKHSKAQPARLVPRPWLPWERPNGSQNGKCSVCYRFCCMKQTFKSLISQLISARVFSAKPGDFMYSSGDREKRQKTGSLLAKPRGLAGLRKVPFLSPGILLRKFSNVSFSFV